MIVGLIALLKAYPALWWSTSQPRLTQPVNKPNDEDDTSPVGNADTPELPSIINGFDQFLELGCPSNPSLLYPALILIISSFPVTVDNVESFFSHLWAAHDGRPLRSNGPQGFIELYTAWSECLLSFGRKFENDPAAELFKSQVSKVWELLGDSGHQADKARDALISSLINVFHRSSFAFEGAWSVIENSVIEEGDATKLSQYFRFLSKSRLCHSHEPLGIKAKKVGISISDRVITHLNGSPDMSEQDAWIAVLSTILKDQCADGQLLDQSSRSTLVEFCQTRLSQAVWNGSKLHYNLFLDILQTGIDEAANTAWIAVMNLNDFDAEITDINQPIITGILRHVTKSNDKLQLPNLGIDQFVLRSLERLLGGSALLHVIIEPILTRPQLFIQDETLASMIGMTSNALHSNATQFLQVVHSLDHGKLRLILSVCNLQLLHFKQITPACQSSLLSVLKQMIVDLFTVKSFLPLRIDESVPELVELARSGQSLATELLPPGELENLNRAILQLLSRYVSDPDFPIHPFDLMEILRVFREDHPQLKPGDFLSLLPVGNPSRNDLISLLPPRDLSALVSIHHHLVHSTSFVKNQSGISLRIKYDRIALAILDLFTQDRQLAINHLGLWENCLYVGELARSSSGSTSCNQGDHLSHDELLAVVSAVDSNTTYFISSFASRVTSSWHHDIIKKLNQPEDYPSCDPDPLKMLILNLAIRARLELSKDLAAISLYRVLASLFKYSDTSGSDFEKWLTFSQQIQNSNPVLCLALIRSLKCYMFANENFQKYQNRLAGKLTDVSSSKANHEGLYLIEVLCATAPPSDSIHIFLPQQRVVFLLQAIGEWLRTDDELENELIFKLLELFSHLAPIVQNVMGSHWYQMVDLITVTLEEGSWEDEESLPLVWHSCLLVRTLQGILKHNRDLQNEIGSQVQACMKLVLDLFCSTPFRYAVGTTNAVLLSAMEDVLRDEQARSLYDQAPINSLVNSIHSPSISTRVLGLSMAQTVVKNLVNKLAVEIELNPETLSSAFLPSELLDSFQVSQDDSQISNLLCWVLIFSYFQNASSRLRNSYSTQLRDANLVFENLIPLLHDTLQVAERGKPIDISIWDIPAFDFSLMEDVGHKPVPLAAYVYLLALQAVPSLFRSWWEGCRNKQLSMSVAGFISRHFSPILISRELDRFKEPGILKSLTDENLSVKVSPVVKEVKVTYTVDEESMEIVIRIPGDYPLQPVEVLDIRKVGIPDTTWRAWILVVQQSIVNHNGSIVDAIGLFKKNISLHFEGVEACAICYAIISVVDRSLPSKACRTCRNRFHPSCLYKWFSTSHGSSCPLCRSLF